MFRLSVLQDQWLIVAIVGGTILVLAFVLACMAIWRPRKAPAADGAPRGRRPSFLPWILIVSYVFVLAYVVIYTIMRKNDPPNW